MGQPPRQVEVCGFSGVVIQSVLVNISIANLKKNDVVPVYAMKNNQPRDISVVSISGKPGKNSNYKYSKVLNNNE